MITLDAFGVFGVFDAFDAFDAFGAFGALGAFGAFGAFFCLFKRTWRFLKRCFFKRGGVVSGCAHPGARHGQDKRQPGHRRSAQALRRERDHSGPRRTEGAGADRRPVRRMEQPQ